MVERLQTFLTMDDPEMADETFGKLDIKDFKRGLKKAINKLERQGDPVDHIRERGVELATLMRDTARWHIDHKGEFLGSISRGDVVTQSGPGVRNTSGQPRNPAQPRSGD